MPPDARRTHPRTVAVPQRGVALIQRFAVASALTLLLGSFASAVEAVPVEIIRGNQAAVTAIADGARIKAIWIAGKFGEYGEPAHLISFDAGGTPVWIEGKFLRLGDDRFWLSPMGNDWLVRGKFADGGSDSFLIRRSSNGRIESIDGRFYHYGDERFVFRYSETGALTAVDGKFGQEGSPGFTFFHDGSDRITEITGKFLIFGDSRFLVRYYDTTKLVRSIEGKFARWGDRSFFFYYEAWPE